MYKNEKERLEAKATYCVLILQKLFPDICHDGNYLEKEGAKMMHLSDATIIALTGKVCPDERDKNVPKKLVKKLRKIDWRE